MTQFLLPRARKVSRSLFWVRRNWAARIFALMPLIIDKNHILHLMNDRSFLVRSIASRAAVFLESRRGILKILEAMQKGAEYEKLYYQDILSQGSNQVFSCIAEYAVSYKPLHLVCLEVLAAKTSPVPTPFLEEDIHSKNLEIRKAALKVIVRNPQKGDVHKFAECLKNSDEEIRVLGAQGLGNYEAKESLPFLKKIVTDPSWKVRYECGKSLQKFGKISLLEDKKLIQYIKEFG